MLENNKINSVLNPYHIFTQKEFHAAAFSRNIGLLSQLDQERLQESRVAIPGMGGVGGIHLVTLARSGVGKFNIADFDVYEPVNINRQFGATMNSLGRPKLEVMKEQAININPYLDINTYGKGIDLDNLDDFLTDVDVVVDGLDFSVLIFEERYSSGQEKRAFL